MSPESGYALRPWQVLLLSPLAGALVTASLAPYDFWPAGIASCAIAVYLLSTCAPKQAAWRGWLYGLGLFGSVDRVGQRTSAWTRATKPPATSWRCPS